MDAFLPDNVKAILLGLIAIVFVLSRFARRFPHVAVLQVFRSPVGQMSEAERERRRRSGDRMAALEMVLAGLALPFLCFASTIMFFNEPTAIATMIVSACSLLCIGLGIWIFVRNWK